MDIRKTVRSGVDDIAKPALIAGEGVPQTIGYRSTGHGRCRRSQAITQKDILYCRTHLAVIDGKVAETMPACRSPMDWLMMQVICLACVFA